MKPTTRVQVTLPWHLNGDSNGRTVPCDIKLGIDEEGYLSVTVWLDGHREEFHLTGRDICRLKDALKAIEDDITKWED